MKHKSLCKTLTYRITSIIITVVVLRLFVKEWYIITHVTVWSQLLKAIWYYCHEKLYKLIKKEMAK